MTTLKLHHGDCLNVLDLMEENSVDAVVTDPPYELSNDGKQSANRVFLEFAFPENSYVETTFSGQNELSTFINKVLRLSVVGSFPRPTPAVPIIPMTFNDDVSSGYKNVKDTSKGSVVVSDGNAGQDIEPKESEHLGCFALKLGNVESALDFINSSGSGFFSGGIGIGLGIESSGFPSLLARFQPVPFCGDDIGTANNTLSEFISAFRGTKDGPVFRFNMGRTSEEIFSADSARLFCAFLICSGSQFVRASTTTSCLPAMLETRRISVVDDLANRAFSFDLVVHPQDINAKGFMGKSWDGSKIAFDVSTWRKVMRVLKPGGHIVAFGAPKNYHRLACAIEDAGFEVRDCLMWVFGQGFPKSQDVSKAIDKAAGAEREVVGVAGRSGSARSCMAGDFAGGEYMETAPATDAAREWQGWGTALKPSYEPIILARKPLSEKTVAANVLKWGCGALNIDATRIGNGEARKTQTGGMGRKANPVYGSFANAETEAVETTLGRWPANLCHSGEQEVVDLFPQNSGANGGKGKFKQHAWLNQKTEQDIERDKGSAARFFYCAKANKHDRAGSKHPTVKPVSLMRWLVRMVTPPGGTVLDPFAGSGTTGQAAIEEGFNPVLIERENEYVQDIQKRMNDKCDIELIV